MVYGFSVGSAIEAMVSMMPKTAWVKTSLYNLKPPSITVENACR